MARAGGLSAAQRGVLVAVERNLPDAPVVIALSGGADSAVCAWALQRAARTVRAISIDHGLPGSRRLMQAAADIARQLGLDHRIVEVAPARSEAALRELRYGALAAFVDDDELVATGHTADDQAETVLAHLLRGSGAAGLAGIPERRDRFIRPLLDVRREVVRTVAAELHLPASEDPANEDRSALRNRIRLDVLPMLREDLFPAVDDALVRTAKLVGADDRLIEGRARGVPIVIAGEEVRIPAAALISLPRSVASRVVRRALRIPFDPYPGSERDVDHVLQVASGSPGSLPLGGDRLATREGPWISLHPAGSPAPPPAAALEVPGHCVFGSRQLTAIRATRPPWPVGRRQADLALDAGASLEVRGARPGDRIDIGIGSQPVTEALREAGIPARLRVGWPVVEADGRMAWIAGARAAAWTVPNRFGEVTRLALGEA